MIWTSYFSRAPEIFDTHPEWSFVSVAGQTPLSIPGFDCANIRKYTKLAPHKIWWLEWKHRFSTDLDSVESVTFYRLKYFSTVLAQLDQYKLYEDLMIFNLHRYSDVVLLCYEPPEKFCHRTLISEWLNLAGIQCSEY